LTLGPARLRRPRGPPQHATAPPTSAPRRRTASRRDASLPGAITTPPSGHLQAPLQAVDLAPLPHTPSHPLAGPS
jgi:hypothetical protein